MPTPRLPSGNVALGCAENGYNARLTRNTKVKMRSPEYMYILTKKFRIRSINMASIRFRRFRPSASRRSRCAKAAFPTRLAWRDSARRRAATSWASNSGFLKLIFALDTRRLLGAHIVGEGATELIHIGQAVINLGGTVDFFVNNTFNYPTLAEAYKIAGLDAWNRMGRG